MLAKMEFVALSSACSFSQQSYSGQISWQYHVIDNKVSKMLFLYWPSSISGYI